VDVPRTLVLTGHFPPAHGGVQRFTWELVRRLPPERVVVVAPDAPGAAAFDRTVPFPVIRRPGYRLSLDLRRIVQEHGSTTGWIPAAAPIGLFAPSLRRAGIRTVVASTHGQELGWLHAGPTRGALREMAGWLDVVTYLTTYSHDRLSAVTGSVPMHRLVGGVDLHVFGALAGEPRDSWRPRVITVGRLVRRKGQDNLLRAWPQVLAGQPDAVLTIVGTGPYEKRLRSLAAALPKDSVEFLGGLSEDRLVQTLRRSHVLVTPSRDDRRGLQTEGLGLTTLEGSAAGLPVVVGRSGGSPDSVLHGRTGFLVDAEPEALAAPIATLLADRRLAWRMGAAGHRWVREAWSWDTSAQRLRGLLALEISARSVRFG
jgi:phosphatidylinositol alpha-1,6-mannosyltransferase